MVKLVMSTESGRVVQQCYNIKEVWKIIREENVTGFSILTGRF